MNTIITKFEQWHERFFGLVSYLRSPFLLFVRLYWGWQLAQSGWGKLHHVAVWPTVHDLHQLASRHYAFEGRCFVLAVGLMMPDEDLPRELREGVASRADYGQWIERGGSAIIGPDSHYVLDPVFDREELLICDLDLNQIDREMMTFDVSGHYSRPDLFRFETKVSVPGEKLKNE